MNNRIRLIVGTLIILATMSSVHVGPLQAQDDASQEQNVELILRLYEGLNTREFSEDFFSEFYASSWTWHIFGIPDPVMAGHTALTGNNRNLARVFPDYVWTIENIAATEDVVMVQYSFLGTFELDWALGSSTCGATQEEVNWEGVIVYRLEDGLIVEAWDYVDNPIFNDPEANCG